MQIETKGRRRTVVVEDPSSRRSDPKIDRLSPSKTECWQCEKQDPTPLLPPLHLELVSVTASREGCQRKVTKKSYYKELGTLHR